MPGVQKPHCRPCSSRNPSCSGCSSLAPASPSTVLISRPSTWTASIVQDLTALPSTSTVHAPQFVVSQPMWVPVSPSPCRIRWASSSRGSTSAIFFLPLIVNLIRRTGTSVAASSPGRHRRSSSSGRPLGSGLPGCSARRSVEDAGHERRAPCAACTRRCRGDRCSAGPPARPGRRPAPMVSAVSGRPVSAWLASVALIVKPPTPVSADAGPGHRLAGGLDRHRDADRGEVADPALELEVAARPGCPWRPGSPPRPRSRRAPARSRTAR